LSTDPGGGLKETLRHPRTFCYAANLSTVDSRAVSLTLLLIRLNAFELIRPFFTQSVTAYSRIFS
jgi:hypothetical protein